MKNYLRTIFRAIPFTIGTAATLLALCYLVRFYEFGMDDKEEFFTFLIWFFFGYPTLVFGVKRLIEERTSAEA